MMAPAARENEAETTLVEPAFKKTEPPGLFREEPTWTLRAPELDTEAGPVLKYTEPVLNATVVDSVT